MPPDEDERVKQLNQYAILDTPTEAEFDRVIRLAQRVFQVPIAFVSFIDRDRQWIKSSLGMEACESPREISFCAHAILAEEVMVVPDATQDERFQDNPLVTGGQRLRFYAGAPIVLPEGFRVGALGVMDTRPRDFSPEETALLQDMADIVVDALELRLLSPRVAAAESPEVADLPLRLRQRYEEWAQSQSRQWAQAHSQLQAVLEQRQNQEDQLRQSESKYRRLIEQSTDGILISDQSGNILETNQAACDILGYASEEMVGHNLSRFSPPENHAADTEALSKLAHGESVFLERNLVRKDGTPVPVDLRVRRGNDGILQTTLRDISDKKRDEEELRNANEELERRVDARTVALNTAIATLRKEVQEKLEAESSLQDSNRRLMVTLESISDGFYALDKEWRYTYVNSSAERISGRTREQLVGRKIWEISPEVVNTVFWKEYQTAVATGEPTSFEEYYPPSNKWYQLHCYPSSEGLSIYFQDISRYKNGEKALQHAKEEAERASEAKTEFLSRMSHELRTPLNAILGFAQLFELDELGPDEHENIQQILRAGRHLLDLINEVLDVARVESGQVTFSIEPVAAGQLIHEVMGLVHVMAAARSITLRSETGPEGPYVYADRQRLKQVLLNLFANAVKYNNDGGQVEISCRALETDHVRIEVKDNGRGMSEISLPKLFTPFERLGVEDATMEGTGIGLALSKRLVELMHGSIGVVSVENEGSTFWIELPYADDPLTLPVEDAEKSGTSRMVGVTHTILYIEDNLSNLKLVERILSKYPEVKLMAGMQGGTGLDLAREYQPKLILLDLHLPDVPGQEVLRRLKSSPLTSHIPVVVLSADATPKQVERLLESGAQDYLTKPINVRRFLTVLNQSLDKDVD